MYDEIPDPFMVIQKFKNGNFQIDKFTTAEDGVSFYDFIKNHTDLDNIEDLRVCVTVLYYSTEDRKNEQK